MGRLERTLFTLEWLQSPDLRRRVTIGLNKGEARNALARAVFFHRLGAVSDRVRSEQANKASALTLLTAAIALWNTVYLQKALRKLADHNLSVPDDRLPHLSPLGWEHIQLTGHYYWNSDSTSKLDRLRPLRSTSWLEKQQLA
jgi:hypothetical protein